MIVRLFFANVSLKIKQYNTINVVSDMVFAALSAVVIYILWDFKFMR
ncbi:MAG: hypothetical protein LBT56_06830 [Prevotellaceae bacterium]|nr:hypothetical protein [Prevotellaceae bacterium]